MPDRSEATAGQPGWKLIEHDGALFRGFALAFPQEVWGLHSGWQPYMSAGKMKLAEWGA